MLIINPIFGNSLVPFYQALRPVHILTHGLLKCPGCGKLGGFYVLPDIPLARSEPVCPQCEMLLKRRFQGDKKGGRRKAKVSSLYETGFPWSGLDLLILKGRLGK